jgi:hypothetical protein
MTVRQARVAVWLQELDAARRTVEGIRRDMERGLLPRDHPALQRNLERLERARNELRRLGATVT